ncbi:high-affinity branched-chain amino acid ABC transporter ATP-binding protein LivG, partial [Campylobacter coli]
MILELKNITKKFGEVRAINETSFHIKEGEIFA